MILLNVGISKSECRVNWIVQQSTVSGVKELAELLDRAKNCAV